MNPPQDPSDWQTLYTWLSPLDTVPAEHLRLVIGFGHFDLRIAQHCCALYSEGHCEQLAFTGGFGAGTADLGKPEAEAFLEVARARLPARDADHILVENRSTNTGENVRFLEPLLRKVDPTLFSQEQSGAIGLVSTPVRMRRVRQTVLKLWPGIPVRTLPPPSDFTTDLQLYAQKGRSLREEMLGELERLRDYPSRGFTEPVQIPEEILAIERELRSRQEG